MTQQRCNGLFRDALIISTGAPLATQLIAVLLSPLVRARVRSVATRFASAQEVLPIGLHPSDNNFAARLHVEAVLGGYEAENRISSPTRSCSRQAFLQIQRWERTEKGVSTLTFTRMITSNRNEHDRSDIRGTRRDNVGDHPVDVEIESRHNSNLDVTCHQRTTVGTEPKRRHYYSATHDV
jgi:hypothetical protein